MTPGQWIDIACAILAVILVTIGCFRGISGHIAHVIGLVAATFAGFSMFGGIHSASASYFKESRVAATISAVVVTLLIAAAILLLLRFVLRRILQLVVKQPFDSLLGAVASALQAFLILAAIFSCVSLLPDCAFRRAMLESSWTGRHVTAAVGRLVPAIGGNAKEAAKQ